MSPRRVYTWPTRLLADWKIRHHRQLRTIGLYLGDLAKLPSRDAVDVLVVSAFSDDYMPTPSSLIGALYENGISVADLARDKQKDMREEFSCWISKPVPKAKGFKRILCIESGWRGSPPEITNDIFRALAPCSVSEIRNGSVAMPLLGAGDQGYSSEEMMRSILQAAVFWLRRGMSLGQLKIVVHSEEAAGPARNAFLEAKQADQTRQDSTRKMGLTRATKPNKAYDVFLSYAHKDLSAAKAVVKAINARDPGARVFFDREELAAGESWVLNIADSLDASRRVAPLYTPNYWKSPYCRDEFAAAYIRQRDTGRTILFPLYFRSADIPSLFRTVQFTDCREGDAKKLANACRALCKTLN